MDVSKSTATNEEMMDIHAKNDYALSRVPQDARKSTLNVSLVAIGYCISMAGLYMGVRH